MQPLQRPNCRGHALTMGGGRFLGLPWETPEEKSGEKIARRCAKFGALAPGRVSPRRRRQAKALSCPVARARRDCQKSTLTPSRADVSLCSLRVLQAAALSDRLVENGRGRGARGARREWSTAGADAFGSLVQEHVWSRRLRLESRVLFS